MLKRYDGEGFRSRRAALILLLGLEMLTLSARLVASDDSTAWIQSVCEANRESIVFITITGHRDRNLKDPFTGTGFIVDPAGYVLTCNHLMPANKGDYVKIEAVGSVGGRYEHPYPLTLVRRDEQADLMLLKLPQKAWHSVKSVSDTKVGSAIVAFGFPLEKDATEAPGLVTGVDNDGRWLTNAGLVRGMSGAPVFDRSGSVVAVVAAGYEEAKSLDLLIPISYSANLLKTVNSPAASVLPSGSPVAKPPAVGSSLLAADLTARLDSVKVCHGDILEIYLGLRNASANEAVIYIGNPMRQTLPKYQTNGITITDDFGMTYDLFVIGGATRLSEDATGAYRQYSGINQYVVVDANAETQLLLMFKPRRRDDNKPASIDLAAEVSLTSGQDRQLRKALFRSHASVPTESPSGHTSLSLDKGLTVTARSGKIRDDKMLEVNIELQNDSASDVAVYLGNPMNQSLPQYQTRNAYASDEFGMTYALHSILGLTRISENDRQPYRKYSGINQYTTIPARGAAQVQLVFRPYRRSDQNRPTSINLTVEFGVLRAGTNQHIEDETLNILGFRID